MTTEKMEWVEIIDPKTKDHMYANLTTGECVWDPPVGVPVKKTDNKQWWELFDHNTGRFYYYNATSQLTDWHRPQNCDIIPLAKLQTLKQNTEPVNCDESNNDKSGTKKSKESVATQTPGRHSHPPPSNIKLSNSLSSSGVSASKTPESSSPRTSRPHHHHHHHRKTHQEGCKSGESRGRRGSQGSWRQNTTSQQDSGRSSDSSSVSLCRHQNVETTPQSASSKPSLAPSPSTPLLKKKSPSQSTKANSFDINISIGGGYSLGQENRSASRPAQRILTGSVSNHGISRSQSFAQKQTCHQEEEEDSMHEKYFVSGRRSADSPMDRDHKAISKLSPDYANFSSSTLPQKSRTSDERSSLRDPSSDVEDLNGATLWSLRRNVEAMAELGHRRVDSGTQSEDRAFDRASSDFWNAGHKQSHPILPLHHYIFEQAKLSGCYRFGDLQEENDSLNSSDDDAKGAAGNMDYDSDQFADDEAVQDDSSSQECQLDDDEEDEDDEDADGDDEDEPSYINTQGSRYPHHHYSVAADYADSVISQDIASSLYCNTRMSQHTVRPTAPLTTSATTHTVPGILSAETQHSSLKRMRDPPPPQPPLYSPILERSDMFKRGYHFPSANSLPSSPSPLMPASFTYEHLARRGLNRDKKLPSESDIEKYAQDNLNIHKKGLFRKKFSVREFLSWSKDPIRKPMLVLSDKTLKKEASEVFKSLQTYMGDRKLKQGATLNSVLLEMCTLAYSKPPLRDELFIQICRQTTENPRKESLIKGWELMAICLYFFPPSPKFQAYLESYMNRHRDPTFEGFPEVNKWPIHVQISHYASVACKRLQRIGASGKRPIRKPNLEEIEQARIQIITPSMFGSTLEEVMELQKSRFPHYKLPWVQTTLSDEVLRLQGTHTEGIFRVSADVDEVTSLKQQLDRWERPSVYTDAHTPASLLKLWYRELYEPLIPDSFYNECIEVHDQADQAAAIVEKLPQLNRMVLAYLIRFLQIFARPEVVAVTKMDASNLAMVMAPNCLRCCCDEPRVMYENARKEMAFIRTLILSMDTAFMQGVL